MQKLLVLTTFILFSLISFAQSNTYIFGYVFDKDGTTLEGVNIYDSLTFKGVSTNSAGFYQYDIKPNEKQFVKFSYTGFETQTFEVFLQEGEHKNMDVIFSAATNLISVEITDERERTTGITKIDAKLIEVLPTAGSGVESIIKSLPGVTSNNELSSQYSVRGGNFDENLVYVNGFEIYRPFLVRSGQQEGLSFLNEDLVSGISFSSGGFEARYDDKLSSVLDVRYKKPKSFGGSVKAGLLGYSTHLEGITENEKFSYLLGLRYKTNQYLLGALPTQGNYKPRFLDLQANFNYVFSEKFSMSYLGNISSNTYALTPDSLTSSFGTIDEFLELQMYFEGQERDRFTSTINGLSFNLNANEKLNLKWFNSYYYSLENEAFDIIGQYRIGQVETDPSKEEFGSVKNILGVGTIHDFARNELEAKVFSSEVKGIWDVNGVHNIFFGLKYKNENIKDRLNEWSRVDSAGFSRPIADDIVNLESTLKSNANLKSNRYIGYLQDSWIFGDKTKFNLLTGVRFNYWDLNKEFFVSPRLQFSVAFDNSIFKNKPEDKSLNLRFSTGSYNQPAFLRELRNQEGVINRNLLSQKSWHFVLGMDYNFKMWNRPFKLTTEAYYKNLWDLVPYDINNVLIRYYGENLATGYARGIDFRLNGQFVNNTDSWFSISYLDTKEDLKNDFYNVTTYDTISLPNDPIVLDTIINTLEVGEVRRATDQRLNFNIFFQDYLPNNENIKVHLNFVFGTGLPFGPPLQANNANARNALIMQTYRRTDLGFSAQLFDSNVKELPSQNPLRNMESIWVTLEIFNLMGFQNTVGHLWIEDFTGGQWAVPNYLTNRLISARLIAKF